MSQQPPDPDRLPQTLDYGSPAPLVPASSVFGVFCGVLAAFVAVAAWVMGIYCLNHALRYSMNADRTRDMS